MLVTLLMNCSESGSYKLNSVAKDSTKEVSVSAFQSLLDSAKVEGSILIYHLEANTYYSNNFKWAETGQLPASTFKIPHSIIALETGVVENEQSTFYWNGENRFLDVWEQDLKFKEAFRYSCVPCYQEIAREIGVTRMINALNLLDYGVMIPDSESIDRFWLQGNSQITQYQQIDFLIRLYNSELDISDRTEKIIKEIMIIDTNQEFTLRGKTGWSIDGEINNGWFVGYFETVNNTYFFATNIEPMESFDMAAFPQTRIDLTRSALNYFNLSF